MFCRPDWEKIATEVNSQADEAELHQFWDEACRSWLSRLKRDLGADYELYESEHFYVVSDQTASSVELLKTHLERTLRRILSELEGIARSTGYGRYVAIVISESDLYYQYITQFYPEEGEFGFSAGIFINDGYGHFVIDARDVSQAEPVLVHELTHNCLVHLNLPIWIDEGLTTLVEQVFVSASGYTWDREQIRQHQAFWNGENIQSFWTGESFFSPDERQLLSYELAFWLIKNLTSNRGRFTSFVREALVEDAGAESARTNLGVTLGDLVATFLGQGNWAPTNHLTTDAN